ncbi:hypothetical protein PLEOSDRAFT_1086259 [Pleurotus ostreatus PC15]|uniref:Uncharacterized protein n=1 Tax=Pleurotus ostreatus (strain PC15) TaxID=1137138 RepID=A0A067NJU3_PLEO1|nr:hypothetical protein PLEOSDRAFT_1086259 [Pleurotus ostreatus PC15]
MGVERLSCGLQVRNTSTPITGPVNLMIPHPSRIAGYFKVPMIQTRVDDRDGRIQYSDGWAKGGSKVEYLGTTTSTTTKGAQFTFSFYGTFIKVFGTLAGTTGPSRAPVLPDTITSYTVDGGEPVLFSGKPGNDVQYNQQFFSSGNLSIGTHTIVGTRVNDGSPVYIDYLVVGAPTPESISGPPVSITWAHSQPATPTTLLATESSSPTSIASPYTTTPVATIIGSIAGGFALRRSQVTPIAACLIVGNLVVRR